MRSLHLKNSPSNKSSRKSKEPAEMSKSSKKKEVPRKCAKIRRTYPSADVEKTELRFVAYNKRGGAYNRERFLKDVAVFLNEQANHMEKTEAGMPVIRQPTVPSSSQLSVSSNAQLPSNVWRRSGNGCEQRKAQCHGVPPKRGVVLVKDLKIAGDFHHAAGCKRADALRTCIPKIEEVIVYMKEANSTRRRKDLDAICTTAQQVLKDARKALREGGPVGDTILARVQSVRAFACQVLHPKETASLGDQSTAESNVNANSSLSSFRR